MVLQDELDLETKEGSSYELIASAYRQLVSNFERTRSYDLAEDCVIGAMEMKRRDPSQSRLVRSTHNIYRLASLYGSSYTRALGVLFSIIFFVALLFPVFGLRMVEPSSPEPLLSKTEVICPEAAPISWCRSWSHAERGNELWGTFKAGILAAFDVASFHRRPSVEPATTWGHGLAVTETLLIPGQIALLLLALRRRFRR